MGRGFHDAETAVLLPRCNRITNDALALPPSAEMKEAVYLLPDRPIVQYQILCRIVCCWL